MTKPSVRRTTLVAASLATSSALLLAGCGASNETPAASGGSTAAAAAEEKVSGTLSGAGASTQAAAQEVWRANFASANPDATVNYDPIGSGGGRKQFLSGGTDYAGTDAYLKPDELAKAKTRCGSGELIEVPLYISPIAIVFKLDGVSKLNLKPATLAMIFNQKIKTWNDPAIKADNPDATLPDTPIAPVNRSDESGTTENFTQYLVAAAKDAWPYPESGVWPVQGGEAAQGTSGVVAAVKAGNGTIAYADASQAGGLTIASIGVGASFEQPTAEAAAKIVESSPRVQGRPQYSFAYELKRDTTESGTYPIVLLSYEEACTNYGDPAKGKLVKAYLSYITGEQGQQAASKKAGNAPLSDTLRQLVKPAIDAIS